MVLVFCQRKSFLRQTFGGGHISVVKIINSCSDFYIDRG